jgi:general secretion pathway protein G
MTHSRSGFTLIEILIAMAIIGLIMGVAAPIAMNQFAKAKVKTARRELINLQSAINEFNVDTNQFPGSLKELLKAPAEENIARRWHGPYLSKKVVPKDPWGNAYKYSLTPDAGAEQPYELYSNGPTGKKGGKKSRMSVWDEE